MGHLNSLATVNKYPYLTEPLRELVRLTQRYKDEVEGALDGETVQEEGEGEGGTTDDAASSV